MEDSQVDKIIGKIRNMNPDQLRRVMAVAQVELASKLKFKKNEDTTTT